MDIPVIPVIIDGNIMASHMIFNGASISMTDNRIGYGTLVSSLSKVCSKDTPMLVADVKGMQKRDIMPDLLREIKMKNEAWMMTGIRNAGDVMDAFQSNVNKIVVPYHFTSDVLLKEMIELSDSCMPALFAERGSVYAKGKKKDLRTVVRTLTDMNFRKVILFDVSEKGSGTNDLRGLEDNVIPYADTNESADALHKSGFADVLVSAVKLFQSASKRSEIGSCMLP